MSQATEALGSRYSSTLEQYVHAMDERALSSAYELGRQAMVDGLGVLDMAIFHHAALQALASARAGDDDQILADRAADFFQELLSPFEMTLRGYRAANDGLRRLAADLEKKVGERTAALSSEVEERKQAEATYRALLEAAPDPILGSDPEGRIVLVNARTEELFGYRRAELIGQPMDLLFPPHLASSYQKHRALHLLPQVSGLDSGIAFTGRRKDATEFPIEMSLNPVAAHSRLALIAILRDVTERRKLEQVVQQAQKMDAIGSLAGGIAHDFNNLLAIMVGRVELAQDAEDTSKVREHLQQISRAADRATALTRQLLAFSRQQVLETKTFNLNGVVSDAVKMLERLIGENIDLATDLSPDLGNVRADTGQIEQVLMNLVVNARDAMPHGGQLRIATANEDLDSNHFRDHTVEFVPGPYVRLAVSDTGIGMDAETKQRIFEPFFTTKEVGKGTGLGLSTVYGIVRQSKGHIWVYSEPGRGTMFKIYLPMVGAKEQAGVQVMAATSSLLRGTETILLVEDSDPLRELGREFLETAGYKVLEARNGNEALSVAADHPGKIDLLLSDMMLPGLSGTSVARQIQASRPSIKVLYVSGYPGETLHHLGALRPGVVLVQKPYTRQAILQKLREVLDERRDVG